MFRQPDGTDKEIVGPVDYFIHCNFADAHGIRFLCPNNFMKNGGEIGTHEVMIFFAGSPVPPEIGTNAEGQTVRWAKSGTGLCDLSLTPSIHEQDDQCGWHGFVTNGDAT